jgi:hypothetical protein
LKLNLYNYFEELWDTQVFNPWNLIYLEAFWEREGACEEELKDFVKNSSLLSLVIERRNGWA